MERTTSALNSYQVQIPNPKSLIQFHRIGSIPDADCQDLDYLSDTRSTIFFLSFISIHFLRKLELNPKDKSNVSFVQKGSIILFSIIIIFNDFQTNASKEEIKERFHVIQKNNAVRANGINKPQKQRGIHKYTNNSEYTQNTSIIIKYIRTYQEEDSNLTFHL